MHIQEYIEPIAELCLKTLITDPFSMLIRRESAKCMRFCIDACKEHTDKQQALFIMTYARLMEELAKRKDRKEFDQVNGILKEIHKMLKCFTHLTDKGLPIFKSVEDAQTCITRMAECVKLIQADKAGRLAKMKVLAKQVDEEDMEYFMEDLEKVDKGIHWVMEISGFLMQNMGHSISGHVSTITLPLYAGVLLDIKSRKDYELIDPVCFICDCLEYGNPALYGQIQGQAGEKFIELIQHGSKDKDNVNYGLL